MRIVLLLLGNDFLRFSTSGWPLLRHLVRGWSLLILLLILLILLLQVKRGTATFNLANRSNRCDRSSNTHTHTHTHTNCINLNSSINRPLVSFVIEVSSSPVLKESNTSIQHFRCIPEESQQNPSIEELKTLVDRDLTQLVHQLSSNWGLILSSAPSSTHNEALWRVLIVTMAVITTQLISLRETNAHFFPLIKRFLNFRRYECIRQYSTYNALLSKKSKIYSLVD